ncbi:phosphotransferase [Haloechinothrix sp. YIM 98757]|uniref:Phosphotransferase n=2 Tax=Haloechinothrix aidingensis TaxID=2752311 RepID=A0A838ADK8_9PSEU|nr:phosphotransferase [Haloechinothrix aidingensis]
MTDLGQGELARLLRERYGLAATSVESVARGQATVNYQVWADETAYFVKHYQAGCDIDAEREAIGQSERAGRHGLPVAPVCRTTEGETIARDGSLVVSVWHWVDGEVVSTGLTPAQQHAAGSALGRIHRLFADQPESHRPAPHVQQWLAADAEALRARVDDLLGTIAARDRMDEFDRTARRTLTERRAALDQLPDLLAGLPELSTQVLHGDYSAVNLLFQGDQLAAVLDFRPPEPFLPAYELGRIAFDPRTVCLRDDWRDSALTLVEAYLHTNPDAAARDVTACARVAAIQLLTSLYGIKEHYRSSGLLQDDLDRFWEQRHRTATTLLEHLPELEHALNTLTGHHGKCHDTGR